jgi:hypothetical protein
MGERAKIGTLVEGKRWVQMIQFAVIRHGQGGL